MHIIFIMVASYEPLKSQFYLNIEDLHTHTQFQCVSVFTGVFVLMLLCVCEWKLMCVYH